MERPLSILLVEDEGMLRRLVALFLRSAGFEVHEAVDGREGLDRFQDSGPYGLVLTDLMMPRLDGVEMCRRLKSLKHEQPIIICSAALLPEQETLLRGLGIASFLSKPYHPDRLMTLVREIAANAPGTPSTVAPQRAWEPACPSLS